MSLSERLASVRAVSAPGRGQDEEDFHSPKRLAISRDGRLVCVAAKDNRVRIWNVETGRLLHTLETDRPGAAVAISAKGDVVIAGTIGVRRDVSEGVRSNLFAWSLVGDMPKLLWKTGQMGTGLGMAIEPRGTWCAAISPYGRLHIFDLRTGEFKRVAIERGNGFNDMAISSSRGTVVTVVTVGQHLKIWEPVAVPLPSTSLPIDATVTEEQSQPFVRAGLGGWAFAVAVSPDGKWAAVLGAIESKTGQPDTVTRIDLSNGRVMQVVARDLDRANCVSISPDGRHIVVGFDAPKVEIRSVDNGTPQTLDLGEFGAVRSLSFVDKGKALAIASQHGAKVEIRSTSDGKRVRELLPDG